MTIDEAIKRLKELTDYLAGLETRNDLTAIKLGIEALKRLKDMRDDPRGIWVMPLPGETKD